MAMTSVDDRGVRKVIEVMGTVVSIDARDGGLEPADAFDALDAVEDWLNWVDATFSTYRHDSEISKLRRGELAIDGCHSAVAEVLDLCADLATETDGYFSARFDGQIDPTGAVKGWAAQAASKLLRDAGLANHAINAGGDVVCSGSAHAGRAWHVGVVNPHDRTKLLTTVAVHDGAVATSGIAERGTHILDPHTGRMATAIVSSTVVGPELARADAYATAVIASGQPLPDWWSRLTGYELMTVNQQGEVATTPGLRSPSPASDAGEATETS